MSKSLILVKTLRHEPNETYRVLDPSKHIVEVRQVKMSEDYPLHYVHKDKLIWVTKECNYIHFIINPSLYYQIDSLKSESYTRIINSALELMRDMKLSQLL